MRAVIGGNDVRIGGFCIHYGNPQEEGVEYRNLFQDHIVALGTPGFIAEHRIAGLDDLLKAPLIYSSGEETDWTTWSDWFAALAWPVPKGRGFHVNNYMIALQAAQDDVGAVLGWDGLVGSLMREERLVKLVPESVPSPKAFYLKIHPRASSQARLFSDWLVNSS